MNHTNGRQRLATVLVLLGSWACAEGESTIEGLGTATGSSTSPSATTDTSDIAPKGGASFAPGRTASGGQASAEASRSTGGDSSSKVSKTTSDDVSANGGAPSSSKDVTATGGRASTGRVKGSSAASVGGARATSSATAKGSTGGAKSIGESSTSAVSTGSNEAQSSSGCGKANYPAACSTKGSPCGIEVKGTARTYYVYLPDKYDAAQPYPLVFQFHPMGGTAEQAISIPSIRSKFPAIYVTPQGLTSGGNTGWPNTNGQDMDFTKAMLSLVQESYCVDKSRIFSTGFSYGGMMSYAIGCEMGDVFRAVAPMSGALYSGCKNGTHAVAMWGSHGLSDNVVPIADGRAGRDAILKRNHCGTETVATTPSPCVSYQGCDSGYPTTWCEFEGSHAPPNFAAAAIVDFFKQF